VQFIVTVLHRPKLLIFDEPFSGFDPINANLLKQEILQLRDEGSTIIFSTHNMGSVEEICSDITLINKGQNILTGNVDELRHRFSDGRCSLTFTGDPRQLMERLRPMSSEFFLDEPKGDEQRLELKLAPGAMLRDVIATANESTDLIEVGRVMASMNDIFIKTVKQNENND